MRGSSIASRQNAQVEITPFGVKNERNSRLNNQKYTPSIKKSELPLCVNSGKPGPKRKFTLNGIRQGDSIHCCKKSLPIREVGALATLRPFERKGPK